MQDTLPAAGPSFVAHTRRSLASHAEAGPNSAFLLDERCAQIYHDTSRCHGDQLHRQLILRLVNHESVFASALEIVRHRRPVAHADFQRRLQTRAIPSDSCNFYACLAGSIMTCSSDDVQAQDAYEISEALVSQSYCEGIVSSAYSLAARS